MPQFRGLLVALGISVAGDWLYNVALLVYVYDHTGSAAWVGAATILRLAPYVLFSTAGGALADRVDRRTVMVVSDLLRAALMALLALAAWRSAPALVVVLIAFASTTAGCAYVPAVTAALPAVVPEDQLASANALVKMVEHLAIVLGPAAGALLLVIGPPPLAFLINAGSFAVSAVLVARLSALPAPPEDDSFAGQSTLARMAAGLQTLGRSSVGRALAGCMMVASCIYGAETVLLVLAAQSRLGTGSTGVGYLFAALGLGGVLCAGTAGRLAAGADPTAALLVAVFAMGLPLAALALVTSPVLAFLLLAVQGAGNIAVDVVAITALQRALPRQVLAGVMGVVEALYIGTTLLGAVLAPILVGAAGLRLTLLLTGVVLPVTVLTTLPALRRAGALARRRLAEIGPVADLLGRLAIFTGVPRASLELLAGSAQDVSVPAGTEVIRQGDPATDLYVVRSGTLDVVARGEGMATPARINTLTTGDYFGEIGLLRGIPRTAGVRATQDCSLVRLDGRAFLDVVGGASSMSGALADEMAGRLARTHPSLLRLQPDPRPA